MWARASTPVHSFRWDEISRSSFLTGGRGHLPLRHREPNGRWRSRWSFDLHGHLIQFVYGIPVAHRPRHAGDPIKRVLPQAASRDSVWKIKVDFIDRAARPVR